MNEEKSEEKIIDIKGTIEQFIKADEPEMSQEEAIAKYKNNNADSGDDAENAEEQEHLKRVKQELLASLERVKKLENQIFNQKEIEIEEKKKLKVEKASSSGKAVQKNREETDEKEKIEQKERE